jgi:type II secretory pathway pseudopilin PulG
MFGMDARVAMLVVAILGLLVYPTVSGIISKSRAEAITASSRTVTAAIENYIADTGSIPASINNLFTTAPTKSSQSSGWKGPYLKGEATARFIPALVWTLEDNDCTSTTTSSRYCTYRVSYDFCKFPKAVRETFVDYYAKAESWTSYNSSTECIRVNYGYAENSGVETYVSFKVKETP